MQTLEAYIETTQDCKTEENLFRQFDIFVGSYGVDVSTYHIVAENLRAIPVETGLVRQNFPKDWVKRYLEKSYADIDPVIEQSRREARPFHWFDVDKKLNLNAKQKEFLEELKSAGLTDGIAVPVFGPKGTMAYFGLGTLEDQLDISDADMMELQFACLQTHNRYIELAHIDDETPIKRLSPRESEVLSLVAAGLSNNYIAERLNISENTVDTMLRRVFTKLGVNNRISAVLRGIGSGLILP
ncbi:MAG: LuxR family transcriptional regulator [Henriciella sp.]|jgi:ATP/maltotriose-dependent transcriptional regulator MalT